MKQRLEKLGQVVTVLLRDAPIPKEYLLFSFERSVPIDVSGFYLRIDESGNIRECVLRHPNGQQPFDESQLKTFKIDGGRVSGSAEGQYESSFAGDSASYSVTFDAPLKN